MNRLSLTLACFLLLAAATVACTDNQLATPLPTTVQGQPTAVIATPLPLTFHPTSTPIMEEIDIPKTTTTPIPSPTLAPTLTASELALPAPTGQIYFFWDPTTFSGGVPPSAPKLNLYVAAPGQVASEWHTQPLLDNLLDWEKEAPNGPAAELSPDQNKIAFTVWMDADGDGDIHSQWGGGGNDLTAIFMYDLVQDTIKRLTDYSSLSYFSSSWLPDNQALAYSWGKEAYLVTIDDVSVRQLTPSFSQNVSQVESSPDGQYLAIHADQNNMYFFEQTTNALVPVLLSEQPGGPIRMKWSPDSQWFAFNKGGAAGLFLVNVNTLEITDLVDSGLSFPAWSPTDSRLVFTRYHESQLGLFLWDDQSLMSQQLLEGEGTGTSSPVWSPDGSKIAVSFAQFEAASLYVIEVSTGEITELFQLQSDQVTDLHTFGVYTWSPDGEWILFSNTEEGMNVFYIINAIEKNLYKVIEIPGNTALSTNIFWLPDNP